ncbi:TetR/AcrR family transcriptional regulator [Butyrivibrio sp. X503]|uniref:TetR/AcrR family transcriptional regulator n=1 Tax=Butyrivibrio sp. X503 TaxID=2364878 RepID=UPI000EA892BB|nr:TetR/AcrR family transcriptional regulator [Butyrivibrio sp. X503]RKM58243.1 TetR/AcrR family transcriptional regulator [Butyrivibrio sp. X503]
MNERFFELKKEKQDRMINAALEVFAKNGYYHSSTDEIVKTAQISKGLLFHYFTSKLGLYAFLYDYSTRFVTLELTQNVTDENGFFELYKNILSAKVDSLAQYPYIFKFLKKADEETYVEAVGEIFDRREKYRRIMEALRARADITVFKPGTDYNKVWDILDFTVDGILERNIKNDTFRADLFVEEALEYIEMIQQAVIT